MRAEFDAYFASAERQVRRFAVRRRGRPFPPSPSEAAFGLVPARWRSDARYFLIANIVEMVIEPFEAVERRSSLNRGPPIETFRDMLEQDVMTIVRHAEQAAERRGRSYVSATSVAIALGEVAEQLKTTSLQIWGPD